MIRPRLLDLFCGAGGAGMGYYRAGFEVVGVDIVPQPNYPFEFHQGDALTWSLEGFDCVHASPPCQAYSEATPVAHKDRHPRLIGVVTDRLAAHGAPYVIENVEGARRLLGDAPLLLCGTMFGLSVWRHRYFRVRPRVEIQSSCNHLGHPVTVGAGSNARRAQGNRRMAEQRTAMGVDWTNRDELRQAIPPAYTEWIGHQLLGRIA